MSILAALNVYHDDDSSRCAAMNMAIDEGLLERAEIPSIRFYRWGHAALSFGYFGRFADVANYAARRSDAPEPVCFIREAYNMSILETVWRNGSRVSCPTGAARNFWTNA